MNLLTKSMGCDGTSTSVFRRPHTPSPSHSMTHSELLSERGRVRTPLKGVGGLPNLQSQSAPVPVPVPPPSRVQFLRNLEQHSLIRPSFPVERKQTTMDVSKDIIVNWHHFPTKERKTGGYLHQFGRPVLYEEACTAFNVPSGDESGSDHNTVYVNYSM